MPYKARLFVATEIKVLQQRLSLLAQSRSCLTDEDVIHWFDFRNFACFISVLGGALVQWLKLPAWEVGDRGLERHSGLQVSKKQQISSPLTREYSIMWEASVTER